MKKIKGNIIYAELSKMTNEKTGEVKDMTKILYTMEIENTDKHVGNATMECYRMGDYLKKLEPFTQLTNLNGKMVLPVVELEIEERPIKNGAKFVISKVNDIVLD